MIEQIVAFRQAEPDLQQVFSVSRRDLWALLLVTTLTGCTHDEAPQTTGALPFAGQDVRLAVPADFGFREVWEGPLNEWAAQSGARYSLAEYTPSESSGPFAGSPDSAQNTLAIFPLEQAAEMIAAGELAPIPASVLEGSDNGIQWQDLFGGVRQKLASRKGQPLFVPLSAPVLVCYFRQDLLSAAGLAPPQTWDDYQQLLDNLATWAPECTAVEPWSEAFRATLFLARAVSLAQHPGQYSLFLDIETGDPLIDSPGFVRALDAARAALQKMPPDVLKYDPADCRNELLQGRAALAIACESPAVGSTAATAPAADRPGPMEIGFIRLPGSREVYNSDRRTWEPLADKSINRVTLTGFSGWGVGTSARCSVLQAEASWNALIKLCSSSLTTGFPPGIVGLCRESQLQSAGGLETHLEARDAILYANAVAQSLRDTRLVADVPMIGRRQFRQSLASALTSAIGGSETSELALQTAARDWREIIGKIGAAKVRDSYRVTLGLSPKPPRE